MSQRPTEKLINPRPAATAITPRSRKKWLIVGGVLACTTIVLAAAWALLPPSVELPVLAESRPNEAQPQLSKPTLALPVKSPPIAKAPAKKPTSSKPANDSKALWASP